MIMKQLDKMLTPTKRRKMLKQAGLDERYTISPCYIGAPDGPHYVVRFCDTWTGCHSIDAAEAVKMAVEYENKRMSAYRGNK